MPIVLLSNRLKFRLMDHYTHVNESKALDLELREERVSDGLLISSPLDLTGLKTHIFFTRLSDGEIITRALTALSEEDGVVSYTFTPADYETDFLVGSYGLAVKVFDNDGATIFEESLQSPAFDVKETVA